MTLKPKQKLKRRIRRFTDDVLSKELRSSIHEMAKNLTREMARKVAAGSKR